MGKQLTVRGLDDDVIQQLRVRAAQHSRSMEAEVREILQQAVANSPVETSLKHLLQSMPDLGSDTDFARNPSPVRPVDLEPR